MLFDIFQHTNQHRVPRTLAHLQKKAEKNTEIETIPTMMKWYKKLKRNIKYEKNASRSAHKRTILANANMFWFCVFSFLRCTLRSSKSNKQHQQQQQTLSKYTKHYRNCNTSIKCEIVRAAKLTDFE